jgi:hypothetical protein
MREVGNSLSGKIEDPTWRGDDNVYGLSQSENIILKYQRTRQTFSVVPPVVTITWTFMCFPSVLQT